ncbi:TetR/AcrR family transcriptional regulator [Micromonospora sp. Llam7]|uniref:TetR/AcrR family transcriptional regulator n=1 Tax=Micromonospora tarapacensis TaxID=2835305 RepID=UPI001C837EB5|nr:TetR/AcrR family transcriptional regulator [Micromonospora tarapacensis]MBX7269349.1 TetR/AcrR family transcriptional regulator [Micromonospora tarapacensis]
MPAATIRARARAEMINEIKAIARRHLATEGANLSLRAVARDMGMVSSAIYRYFPSRDDLLTALIVDGYHALGDAAEAADAEVTDRTDLRGRWLAVSHAVRRWALAHPAEYALLFGSPVPGYAAPQETTVAATRTPATMIGILLDGFVAGTLTDPGPGELPGPVRADLAAVRDALFEGLPESLLARGATGWLQCFGAVSFELFGQLDGLIEAREEHFDHQMRRMSDLIGLP